jgi:hypothetical protein
VNSDQTLVSFDYFEELSLVLGRNAIPENVLWVKREGVYAAIF